MSTVTTTTTTQSHTYDFPLRSRITFTSNDLEDPDVFFVHDGFDPHPEIINVIYSDVERAAGESGSFNVVVEDSGGIIEKDHLQHCRVLYELGKTSSDLGFYAIGKARIFDIRRPQTGYAEYLISGPSTKIRAAELMLLWRKSTSKTNNPDYGIGNLVKDSMTDRKPRPLNREPFDDITGWHVDLISEGGGISDRLNQINLPIVNEVYTTYWDWLDRNAAMTGAPWDLDYDETTGQEILTMDYPASLHTGVTIKSGDLQTDSDPADKTGYIIDEFSIQNNSSSDVGVLTRLYTSTIIDRQSIVASMHDHGSTSLVGKAIGQQFIIQNDQRRITEIALILSKVGEPESPKSRVNGDLVLDWGDNTPRGQVLASFQIPLSDIKEKPDTIFISDIDTKVRFLQGNNKVWIRLFRRAGLDGGSNTDEKNTIRWHHSGTFGAPIETYSATTTDHGGDYSKKEQLIIWNKSNTGPTYAFDIFSSIRRLQARTNVTAAKQLDIIESFYDTSHLQDYKAVNSELGLALARRSKTRTTIPIRCTIPNHFLYKPYQLVDFADSLSNRFQTLQVARARYVQSTTPGENPLGAMWAEVTLQGDINPLVGFDCSCL